eukprot:480288-Prymnesium_polylepis.3
MCIRDSFGTIAVWRSCQTVNVANECSDMLGVLIWRGWSSETLCRGSVELARSLCSRLSSVMTCLRDEYNVKMANVTINMPTRL